MNTYTTKQSSPSDEILRRHLETLYLAAWRTLHPLRYDFEKPPLGPFFVQTLDESALRILLRSAIDGTCDDLLYAALEAPLRLRAPTVPGNAAWAWWTRVSWLKARILGCFEPWHGQKVPTGRVPLTDVLTTKLREP